MKRILYIVCAIFALVSCSKEESTTQEKGNGAFTFNLALEEPDYVPQTKSTVTMQRYLLELYKTDLTTTPVKLTSTNGEFNVNLEEGSDYVCLFWADNGTDAYDATSLKAVKQANEAKLGTAAYFAKVIVNTTNFDGAIKLKRAVAELSFIEKNGLTATTNELTITYPYSSATFNLGNGTVTYATGTVARTIKNIAPPMDATSAFASDLILAPTVAGKLNGLKLKLNNEEEKNISATIQANYKTKITGEYQLKPKPLPKVGDFYMKDGSCVSKDAVLTTEQKANCIGIVFFIETTDQTKGKIVSLDESGKVNWSKENVEVGAKSDTDGAGNTSKVLALGTYSAIAYPAFGWCAAKNPSSVEGIHWYLPAQKELNTLSKNKTVVNNSLTIAGKTILAAGFYWSSTEYSSTNLYAVNLDTAFSLYCLKSNPYGTRAVSAF